MSCRTPLQSPKHIPRVPLQLCLVVPVEARLQLSKAAGKGLLR